MTSKNTTAPRAIADGRGDVTISPDVIRKVFWRWNIFSQMNWNYEKMQGSGYCFSMFPLLEKVYGDDQDAMQQAVRTHLQFFNSSPQAATAILGMNCALEPKLGLNGLEAIAGLKSGLMGPFAGIGDSLFGVVLQTIFGAIAAYQALSGSAFGCILFLCVGLAMLGVRWALFKIGYSQGQRAVETITEHLRPVTEAASVLGLTVVGALVTTVVSVKATGTFQMGDYSKPIQEMLDGILPGLLPMIAVIGVYALLSRKGMTSNKAIFIVIAIGLVIGCSGILA